jgi:thiol-disulfide isomerase/thioredoxin
MKIVVTLLLLHLLAITNKCYSQKKEYFIIHGDIKGIKQGFLKLTYISSNKTIVVDTLSITKGKFTATGSISSPINGILSTLEASNSANDPNSVNIFLEPRKLTISLKLNDFKNAVVHGSISHAENQQLIHNSENFTSQINKISKTREQLKFQLRNDSSNISLQNSYLQTRQQIIALQDSSLKTDIKFIQSNPKSFVSANLLRIHLSDIPLDKLIALYSKLTPDVKKSIYGSEVEEFIKTKQSSSPGAFAPLFISKDLFGKRLSLKDINANSYVLLDFWGSWCKPCRANNPKLIKLYKQYNHLGFNIIGIAHDDNSIDEWKKAIETDNIGIWYHTLRGFDLNKLAKNEPNESDIGYKYGVNIFPTQILINKAGIIIARYEGENIKNLESKLQELFDH